MPNTRFDIPEKRPPDLGCDLSEAASDEFGAGDVELGIEIGLLSSFLNNINLYGASKRAS
jgi:hypothetical protein